MKFLFLMLMSFNAFAFTHDCKSNDGRKFKLVTAQKGKSFIKYEGRKKTVFKNKNLDVVYLRSNQQKFYKGIAKPGLVAMAKLTLFVDENIVEKNAPGLVVLKNVVNLPYAGQRVFYTNFSCK